MKKNILKSISIVANFMVILTMVFVAFFATANEAQAACSYKIIRFDSNGQTTVSVDGSLDFTAQMERSGTLDSSCFNKLNFELYFKDGSGFLGAFKDTYLDGKSAQFQAVPGKGSIAEVKFRVDVRNLDRSNLDDPNKLDFYVKGIYDGFIAFKPLVSSVWTVNLSGGVGGNFSVKINPQKAEYNQDENISLDVFVNPFNLRIDSSISLLYITVKNKGKELVSRTISRNDIYGKTFSTGTITISKANSFSSGPNILTVKLFQAGTNLKIGESSVSIQATGFGTPDTNTGGKGAGQGSNTGGKGGSPPQTIPEGGKLYNPLPSGNLITMFLVISKGFLTITAIVSVVFIIVGGFMMVISAGNEETQTKGKKTLTWAILGLIIASLSFSIVAIVENLLQAGVK